MSEEIDWKSRAEAAELLNEEYRIQLLMADKISGEQRSRAEAAEAENDRLQARVDNLAALLRILVHSLRKVNPNSSNIVRAMDYLKRNGLTGSILRSDEPQPAEIPDSGGHLESADCWCGPTVEEHPGGTLIIHIRTH